MKIAPRHLVSLLILLFINFNCSFAQRVALSDSGTTLQQYIDQWESEPLAAIDSEEGGRRTMINAAKTFWGHRVTQNDTPGEDMFKRYYSALGQTLQARSAGWMCQSNPGFAGNWSVMGPWNFANSQQEGFVHCVWSGTIGTENIILAGTYGGLFKSVVGGTSQTWTCITDNAQIANGFFYVTSIAVKPNDHNVIYISTQGDWVINSQIAGVGGSYGSAIWKSTDGGTTWTQEPLGGNDLAGCWKVYFTPDGSRLYAFSGNTIWTRTYSTSNTGWVALTANDAPGSGSMPIPYKPATDWNDLVFIPNDANANTHFFASNKESSCQNYSGVWEINVNTGNNTFIYNLISRTVSGFINGGIATISMSSPLSRNANPFDVGAGLLLPPNITDGTATKRMYFTVNCDMLLKSVDVYASAPSSKAVISVYKTGNTTALASVTTPVLNGTSTNPFLKTQSLDVELGDCGEYYLEIRIVSGTFQYNKDLYPPPTPPIVPSPNIYWNTATGAYRYACTAFSITHSDDPSNNQNSYYYVYNWQFDQYRRIELSAPNDHWLYVFGAGGNTAGYLTRYELQNPSWHTISTQASANANCMDLAVSPTPVATSTVPGSPDYKVNIYLGSRYALQAYYDGTTLTVGDFIPIGESGLSSGDETHADTRCIFLKTPSPAFCGFGDDVYLATDGGVSNKPVGKCGQNDGMHTTVDVSGTGLACATVWNAASSEEGGLLTGGAQHDGLYSYEPDQSPKWVVGSAAGGMGAASDGASTIFDKADRSVCHATEWTFNGAVSAPVIPRKIGTWLSDINLPEDKGVGIVCPFFVDEANTRFVGQHLLYTAGATSWTSPAGNYGLPTDGSVSYIDALSFSQYRTTNSPTGYVLYFDDASKPATRKLYYRNPALTTPILNFVARDMRNSGTSITGNYPMVDVVTDPQNPERVWVALGGITGNGTTNTDNTRRRLLYNDHGGADGFWHDISRGLPPRMPVTALAYQEGSNIVYCATDVGIYVCDMSTFDPAQRVATAGASFAYNPSVKWYCFNKGADPNHDFPPVYVTDLEINYCSGKLIASTYGRSFWWTDLYYPSLPAGYAGGITGSDEVPGVTDVINASSPNTWTNDRYITGSILVKSGYTLTIKTTGTNPQTTIHMPRNGAIIVEPGAKIVVDNAHITNDCDYLWKGILVLGNPAQRQLAANQGTAIITNGSILENARVAVCNWGESLPNKPWWTSAGGIIQADHSLFLNNTRSAAFAPYQNHYFYFTFFDNSYFDHCKFSVDDYYRGENKNYYFIAGVTMSDVYGVKFISNVFENQSSRPHTKHSGFGITSWNAGYIVKGACPNPNDCDPNTFIGYNVGINAAGSKSGLDFAWIDNAVFERNGVGVFTDGCSDLGVYQSSFSLQTTDPSYSGCSGYGCVKGIYAKNTPQFRIEENQFFDHSNASFLQANTYGVYLDGNGPANNQVYRNSFDRLAFACYAIGSNTNGATKPTAQTVSGTEFLCNTYVNNPPFIANGGLDIAVVPNGGDSSSLNGVRTWQGMPSMPTNNIFSPRTQVTWPGNTRNFTNTGHWLNYYYGNANDGIAYVSGQYPILTTQIGTGCRARNIVEPTNSSHQKREAAQTNFATAKATWLDNYASLKALMDYGNTDSLIAIVDASDPSVPSDLINILDPLAPYVSGDVMREVVSQNKLDASTFMKTLESNPEELTPDMLQFLAENGYTDDQISELLTYANTMSARSQWMEKYIGAYSDMSMALKDIILLAKTDSAGVDIDTVGYWYHQVPELWARYQEAMLYLHNSKSTTADSVINDIPTEFNLTTDETDDYKAFKDAYGVIKNAILSGRDELRLDSLELDSLQRISNRNTGNGSNMALLVYNKNKDIVNIPCNIPDSTIGQRPALIANSAFGGSRIQECNVYPNPASSNVTFDYNFPLMRGAGKLIVLSMTGQRVFERSIEDKRGFINWDVSMLPSGTYLYRISDAKRLLSSGKVTLTTK
jgi:hypothetical protein